MKVEVVNTGTELLLGNTINTHLGFLGRELFPLGLRIDRQVTVPDGESIRVALIEAFGRAEVVLVTGGLGPTTDDVTREITAELLNLELHLDAGVMQAMEERFARRGLVLRERNRRQAMVPAGATVLANPNGTAPGLYLPPMTLADGARSPHLFLLPGPPRELRPMFSAQVKPILEQAIPAGERPVCEAYRLTGIGESEAEARVGERLLALPGLELGYCARPGEVEIRLIGAPGVVAEAAEIVRGELASHIIAGSDATLAKALVDELSATGETLATVESCPGGSLAAKVTDVPGASGMFLGGFVTYANAAKVGMVGVDAALIEAHGAVSEAVAAAMVTGALEKTGATYALSTTGIAGPDGGTDEKPVGLVFIGCGRQGGTVKVERFQFKCDRETFKESASQAALNLLWRQRREA